MQFDSNIQKSVREEYNLIHNDLKKKISEINEVALKKSYFITDGSLIHLALSYLYELQEAKLSYEVKEKQLKILQTLHKIYQLAPPSAESELLEDMLLMAIIIDKVAHAQEIIKCTGKKIENIHLFWAICTNSEKMIKCLVDSGADPVDSGADPNGTNGEISLLQAACLRGKKSEKAIFALVDKGANLENLDGNGRTPMDMAIVMLPDEAVCRLLDKIKNINLVDGEGESLLHRAIQRQNRGVDNS